MAGATHRGGQTGLPRGWPHRNSETGGAMRGPQPAVHDLLWDLAHYRQRLHRYSVVVAEEIIADWRRSSTVGFVWKVDFAKA